MEMKNMVVFYFKNYFTLVKGNYADLTVVTV